MRQLGDRPVSEAMPDRKSLRDVRPSVASLVAVSLTLGAGACGGPRAGGTEADVATSPEAAGIVNNLRARLDAAVAARASAGGGADDEVGSPLEAGQAAGFRRDAGGLRPRFATGAGKATARVLLPARAAAPLHLEDAASGLAVDVSLAGARQDAEALVADGFVVYRGGHESGAALLHRPLPEGVEDYLAFDARPSAAVVTYRLALGAGVAGLRQVDGTLELLDAGGAPRLRVSPPYLVGADGARADAVLAVDGCAVDTNRASPWGRAVTSPGAAACTLRVGWEDAAVKYPAVLDPRWTSTASMATDRYEHTATLLSDGRVLVVGGRSTTSTTSGILSSAERYDPASGTWSPAGNIMPPAGMTAARRLHSAVQLGATTGNPNTAGKVLVAGGIRGTVSGSAPASLTTTSLYDVTANSWVAGPTMSVARHEHTATLMASGNVVVIGGLTTTSSTTVRNDADGYNPAGGGTGGWSAVGNTMSSRRRGHTATLLVVPGNPTVHNKVLVVGGNNGGTTNVSVNTAQLFDGTTWTSAGTIAVAREGHTATALANGNLLIVGGKTVTGTATTYLQSTQVFNAGTGTWNTGNAGTMVSRRIGHTATLLPTAVATGGKVVVLVGGSSDGSNTLDSAEIWDGATSWTATAALSAPPAALSARKAHTATPVGNKGVLVAGGLNGSTVIRTAGRYDSSFALACTANSDCVTGFCVDGVCCNSACTGGCSACNRPGLVGTCSPKPGGTACEDGNYCTTGDTCNAAGVCQAGAPKTCMPTGQCRGAGTCEPTTGECSSPPANEGLTCNDGNRCTQNDVCRNGTCLPGATSQCPAGVREFARVTDLGVLRGHTSMAFDISEGGEVVGSDYSVSRGVDQARGFRHKPNGQMVEVLPPPERGPSTNVYSINNDGAVAADTGNGGSGFRQTAAGAIAKFIIPSRVVSINAIGDVVGHFWKQGGHGGGPFAFRHAHGQLETVIDELSGFTAPELNGTFDARAITDEGRIVGMAGRHEFHPGFSGMNGMSTNAAIFTGPGGAHDLNADVVSPSGWMLVGAWDAAGPYVVGHGIIDGDVRGYRFHDGIVDEIPSLDAGHPRTWASGVNARGDVVGTAFFGGGGDPRAWVQLADGRQYDLTKLLDTIEPRWDPLLAAMAINMNYEIVGYGVRGGVWRAYKMKLPEWVINPTPENTLRPFVSGVVEHEDGTFTALFGYDNDAATAWEVPAGGATNFVSIGTTQVQHPAPPSSFLPGRRPGAFQPRIKRGATISWRLAGQTVTASFDNLPRLTKIPIGGGGFDVDIGGTRVNVRPDMTPFERRPEPVVAQGDDPAVGGEFHGTLNGSLAVSPTGAAVYTVPIAIPPGIGGMAPNLSLVYNSQAGPGLAGQGWELSGLSTIHRCPNDGIKGETARHPDDLSPPVWWATTFCLDGQHLYRTLEEGTNVGGPYHTEKEDFSVIRRSTDPDSFTVVTKSGEVRYYGLTEDSRVQTPGGPPLVYVWALSRVMDSWGNYYDVHYNTDHFARGLLVTQIDYTGHTASRAAGAATDDQAIPPFRSVKFHYGPRPDTRTTRLEYWSPSGAGSPGGTHVRSIVLPRNALLTHIETNLGMYSLSHKHDWELQNDPPGPTPEWATPTAPTKPSLAPSQLVSIRYCAFGANGCLDDLVFDWDAVDIKWDSVDGYKLPIDAEEPESGARYVDLDGDGRQDLVQSKEGVSRAWHNTGTRWEETTASWRLPLNLTDADNKPVAFLADIDGDGLPDLIRDHAAWVCQTVQFGRLNCDDPNVTPTCEAQNCAPPGPPLVWLNRLNTQGQWVRGTAFESVPSPWAYVHFRRYDTMADMNGDGRVDIIRMKNRSDDFGPSVLHSDDGWRDAGLQYLPGTIRPGLDARTFRVQDVNRDGLPDLLGPLVPGASGSVGRVTLFLNERVNAEAFGDPRAFPDMLEMTVPASVTNVEEYFFPKDVGFKQAGDIDGDGRYDILDVPLPCQFSNPFIPARMHLASGAGYASEGTEGFLAALNAVKPPSITTDPPPTFCWGIPIQHYEFALADLNADGLVDLIYNRPAPNEQFAGASKSRGQFFLNTGSTWRDLYGKDRWIDGPFQPQGPTATYFGISDPGPIPVPAVPPASGHGRHVWDPMGGVRFMDLDGDGVTDLVESNEDPTKRRAWLNRFRPPVIRGFPNGLARKTQVYYQVVTTAAAHGTGTYIDSRQLKPGTTYSPAPLRVVSAMESDDGIGSWAKQTYVYADLRGSAWGRGPQGFASMTVRAPAEPGTNHPFGIVTRTEFAQAFPYTGMPTKVERMLPLGRGRISLTETRYCDAPLAEQEAQCTPHDAGAYPRRPVFVYPFLVTDTSFLRDSTLQDSESAAEKIHTLTHFRYDEHGNSTRTVVVTTHSAGDSYENATELQYGEANSDERRMGKPTRSTVRIRKLTNVEADDKPINHTTQMTYAVVIRPAGPHYGLALTKRIVEPAFAKGIRLDTAFEYDRFGNVITMMNCDDNFDRCRPDEQNPAGLGFRATRVSFDPADFHVPGTVPITTLPASEHHPGQYPVMTTNALGHKEYTAHSPLLGLVIQQTGPNGITACNRYDGYGRKLEETTRCGSPAPLTTTFRRFRSAPPDSPWLSKVVTVTRPPGSSATWVYGDALGREIASRTRGFDGRLVEASKAYDPLGRPIVEIKPHYLGEAPYAIGRFYDELGRTTKVTQQIGDIDGTGALRTSEIRSFVERWGNVGTIVRTEETVAGVTRTRREKKNVLGKVATVWDANEPPTAMSYRYNVEGNLRDVDGPAGNMHIGYDDWGRKKSTSDPDMGTWGYVLNGFGEPVDQSDAKGRHTTTNYDLLGRRIAKTDASGTVQWIYDRPETGPGIGRLSAVVGPADPGLRVPCSIPYASLTDGNRSGRWFRYTPTGDLEVQTECIDGDIFSTEFRYDEASGRVASVTYPTVPGSSNLTLHHQYTPFGHLQYVSETPTGPIYWAATAANAAGQVTAERTRNGVETVWDRNPSTGWLLSSTSTARAHHDTLIQSRSYSYDEAGNLRTRSRADWVSGGDASESFTYDRLDRLKTSHFTATGAFPADLGDTYDYDRTSNLTLKGGKSYSYTGCMAGDRAAGPHAVCSVAGSGLFRYDDNGNLTAGQGREIQYNASNKPIGITASTAAGAEADATVRFAYGADNDRVVQSVDGASGVEVERTVYVGMGPTGKSLYERTTRGSTVEHVQFLYAGGSHGGSAFALRVATVDAVSTPPPAMKYYHFDHLGSVAAMSDETGYVLDAVSGGSGAAAYGYDAWGARRRPGGAPVPVSSAEPVGRRGFTGHEAIPSVGLVNMNGRVYDPALGRFLSPDPNVQFAADLQSYNRYSYVHNNPLRYTDPTGFFLSGTFGSWVNLTLSTLSITVCVGSGGSGCGIAFSIAAALYNASAALAGGASLGHVMLSTAIGLAAERFGGLYGEAMARALGGAMGPVMGGAVSEVITSTITTGLQGGDLGRNVVAGAAQGAFFAGFRWAETQSRARLAQATGRAAGDAAARAVGRGEYDREYAKFRRLHGGDAGRGVVAHDLGFAPATGTTTTVTVKSAIPDLPGGNAMAAQGKYHQWIMTEDGREVGMGNAQGVPGENGQSSPDLPYSATQTVDHSGRDSLPVMQVYSGVNLDALDSWLALGQDTGPWSPGANDCNTWVEKVINASTPHSTLGPDGMIYNNVVKHADGSIYTANGAFQLPGPEGFPPSPVWKPPLRQ
jgi:RHS repeat-associated protein